MHLVPMGSKVQDEIIPVVCGLCDATLHSTWTDSVCTKLPFWTLVSFGSYLLGKLGWGVLTFNDVPDAHKELMGEIDLARKELRKKGIDVD